MPGDPVEGQLARIAAQPDSFEALHSVYTKAFGLDLPVWKQYLNFWSALFLGLLVPAILLSWLAGNICGALAARRKWLDNTVLPVGYVLTATPYMWLGILLAWGFGSVLEILPLAGACSFSLEPAWSLKFIASLLEHWFLPFASLFLVGFGGWAIGMRNMIIYELEADY